MLVDILDTRPCSFPNAIPVCRFPAFSPLAHSPSRSAAKESDVFGRRHQHRFSARVSELVRPLSRGRRRAAVSALGRGRCGGVAVREVVRRGAAPVFRGAVK